MNSQNIKLKLYETNKILIIGRLLYITSIGLTGVISKLSGGPNENFSSWQMVAMTTVALSINFLYFYYFRKYNERSIKVMKILTASQLIIDQIFFSIIIFLAGGLTSISFLYYIYDIIAAAFFYSIPGVIAFSTTASLMYSGIICSQNLGLIPYLPRYNLPHELILSKDFSAVTTNVFAVVTSFYIIGIFSGIIANSLRKKEAEITAERDKEKAILSDLSDGLIYIDSRNVIDLVNIRAEKLLSFKAEDVLGKKIREINFKKLPFLKEALQTKSQTYELNFSGMQDNYIRITTVEVRNDDQKLIGTAKIVHDISREKYVDKMKSEFITIAGHQLRTPLSAIKGALSLFLSGDYGEVNREQRTMIKQSYDYTERLIKLVNDMLNVSSAEEGKFSYEFAKTDVKDFVEKNSERFVDEADSKKISLLFNIAEGLPLIELDQRKFRLVFNALLENALVYNKEKGSVRVSFDKKDDKLMITISDTGIGIPKDVQEKIFTKFFRAENALKFFTEGNGLDLFVVKNIIDNHQGDIWFESEPEKGTTFYIAIPFSQTKKGVIEK